MIFRMRLYLSNWWEVSRVELRRFCEIKVILFVPLVFCRILLRKVSFFWKWINIQVLKVVQNLIELLAGRTFMEFRLEKRNSIFWLLFFYFTQIYSILHRWLTKNIFFIWSQENWFCIEFLNIFLLRNTCFHVNFNLRFDQFFMTFDLIIEYLSFFENWCLLPFFLLFLIHFIFFMINIDRKLPRG